MADYFVPVLFGLILLMALCRLTVFWFKETTPRVFFSFLIFGSLCFLYFVAALRLSIFWRDAGRAMMLLSLLLGIAYECIGIIAHFRQKGKPQPVASVLAAGEQVSTLKAMTAADVHVVLDGTGQTVLATEEEKKKNG